MAKKAKSKQVLGVKITRGDVSDEDLKTIHKFALALERGRFNEYIETLQNPKKLLWKSFISGIGKGFGAVIGAIIVVSIVAGLLALIGGLWPGDDPLEETGRKLEQTTQ